MYTLIIVNVYANICVCEWVDVDVALYVYLKLWKLKY